MKHILLFGLFCFSAVFLFGGGQSEKLKTMEQQINEISDEQKSIKDAQMGNERALKEMQEAQTRVKVEEKTVVLNENHEWRYIPLDGKIFRDLTKDLAQLDYFVSDIFTYVIPPDPAKNTRVPVNGILVDTEEKQRDELPIKIIVGSAGKMIKFLDTPRESMEILFTDPALPEPNKSALMIFFRNEQDHFILRTMIYDGRTFDVKDKNIMLMIRYIGKKISETDHQLTDDGIRDKNVTDEKVIVDVKGSLVEDYDVEENQLAEEPKTEQVKAVEIAVKSVEKKPDTLITDAVNHNTKILPDIPKNLLLAKNNQSYLKPEFIINYMVEYSAPPSWFINDKRNNITAIVKTYIEEARQEQINPDIAIAQMWYATQKLSNETLLKNCNYAGLEPVSGFPDVKEWSGNFTSIKTGIRAHIQHLKGLSSKEHPQGKIDDPRYDILVKNNYIGNYPTLDKLSQVWTKTDAQKYENSINDILRTMYKYQFDNDKI